MEAGSFRFEIGEFECVSVSDGSLNYSPESFFANVPLERVEEVLRERNLPTAQVMTPYTCLFINTGEHRVMVDTGAGDLGAHAADVFPGLDHSTSVTGLLPENLRAAGIGPLGIDTVIITHAHPDHVGGTLDETGALVFPNAYYYISPQECGFWRSDAATTKAPSVMVDTARRNLKPIKERLTFVENTSEVIPDVHAIATFGHTPGHIAMSIASEGSICCTFPMQCSILSN
jgi:glyoxylase-like metal-dependent hydrolase (beta-lactamase superfamily II)